MKPESLLLLWELFQDIAVVRVGLKNLIGEIETQPAGTSRDDRIGILRSPVDSGLWEPAVCEISEQRTYMIAGTNNKVCLHTAATEHLESSAHFPTGWADIIIKTLNDLTGGQRLSACYRVISPITNQIWRGWHCVETTRGSHIHLIYSFYPSLLQYKLCDDIIYNLTRLWVWRVNRLSGWADHATY